MPRRVASKKLPDIRKTFLALALTRIASIIHLMCLVARLVQSLSRVWIFATPWTAASQAFLAITNSCSLLKLMSIESVIPSNYLILCHPLHLLPSIFSESGSFQMGQFFTSGGQSIGVSSFNISPSNEHSGLVAFRMDWFDLLAVQGTLKSLQHHTSKASILRCSAFFIVQTLTSIHDY